LQEEWDNSGLLIGEWELDVNKVYLSLDVDESVLEKVEENSLIIAHHPVIFRGIKNVVPMDFSRKFAYELIRKNVNFIAMHTNFDKTHLNEYFARKILGFEGESEDFVFYSDIFMKFDELVSLIKEKVGLNLVRAVKVRDLIKRVAITTGAGMSLLPFIKADCFITGDIKYHEAMDAKARDISLIDLPHYESERYFVDVLYEALYREIEDSVEIVKLNSQNPFELI
jgi:dinuclear metal center YbgI/SA1388 family protein